MIAIRMLILSLLIPREFSITIGTLFLPTYRVLIIAFAPYVIWLFFKRFKKINWNVCDLLAIIIFTWPIIAFFANTGLAAAVESGGAIAIEMAVPYFLVRLNVSSYRDQKAFSRIMFLLVAILFFTGLPEAFTGRNFIHEIAYSITGNGVGFGDGLGEQRLGIWRSSGPMDHPILFGTLCASITAVAIAMALRQNKYWLALIFSLGGVVFSASSGPLLAVLVQFALVAWTILSRGVKRKWWLLIASVTVIYIAVDLASNRSPFEVMFTYFLINPDTGYARYYMWINSFIVVSQSTFGMVFGYGYDVSIFDVLENNYFRILMQHTVDSFWLVQMLRYGMTMALLFSVFLILHFRTTIKNIGRLRDKRDKNLLQAWLIGAIAMTLLAATVHFWGQMICIYMMILALCMGREHSGKSKRQKT